MINFKAENDNYNDFSMVDYPIRPGKSSKTFDIYVRNLLDTQRRTFSISISEKDKTKALEVTRTTLFIAFGSIILCCVCSIFMSRLFDVCANDPNRIAYAAAKYRTVVNLNSS